MALPGVENPELYRTHYGIQGVCAPGIRRGFAPKRRGGDL